MKTTNKASTGMKCQVKTVEFDDDSGDVSLYISNHNYLGYTELTIEELKTIRKTLSTFLKKYKAT